MTISLRSGAAQFRHKKTPAAFISSRGYESRWSLVGESVADDGTTVLGDDNINAVIAAGEFVGQNLATKQTFAATIQAWLDAGTTSRNTSGNFVGAAAARILHAPGDFNVSWRRRTAANRSRCATSGCRIATPRVSRRRTNKSSHGNRHATRNKTFHSLSSKRVVKKR